MASNSEEIPAAIGYAFFGTYSTQAALRALLEKTEAMAASGDDAHQALVTAEERVAELEVK